MIPRFPAPRCAALAYGCALSLAACIGQSPELQAELDLGPEQPGVPQGPEHRPGQPCRRCHGEDHTPGGLVFALAGTVYRTAGDARGLAGAEVLFEDADGRSFTARTNRVGTFFVRADGNGDNPRQGSDGSLQLPYQPAFPLRVRVRAGDQEQAMQGLIWREGSCGACHGGTPSARSNGVIFIEEASP